jgi:hypothetical protein
MARAAKFGIPPFLRDIKAADGVIKLLNFEIPNLVK